MQQEVSIFQNRFHPLRVGYEVGGKVSTVELHALHDLQGGVHAFGFFNRDDAILAYFVHRLRDDFSDSRVVVGGDSSDLGDFIFVFGGFREFLYLGNECLDRIFDAPLDVHGVGPRGDILHAFPENGLRQNRGGGGAIAGIVTGLAGDLVDHLCAHVLKRILKFNLFGYGYTVLGDGRGAKFFIDNHVAPLGAQCELYGICQLVDTGKDLFSCIFVVSDLFSHLNSSPSR